MASPLDFLHMSKALRAFTAAQTTQNQEHIKPFHRHLALRLVIEGGFLPDEVRPHPPVQARRRGGVCLLELSPSEEGKGELTVFGGMKTKQIDVVVVKNGIGPVAAVSVKGTLSAYRNLVNRMEEAIGDSTNVHVMYPGLVYGFIHLLRTNRAAAGFGAPDLGIDADGAVSPAIQRYFAALCEMTGRRFIRNDFTRYESVGFVMVENQGKAAGEIFAGFPPADSPLQVDSFFARLYQVYDLRFPLRAEHLPHARRSAWAEDSPLFAEITRETGQPLEAALGYVPRLG